jgi:ATP-binding cassette subfamily F protein uup
VLADPQLYARDPAAFSAKSAELDGKLAERSRAEEQWLELELKRETLERA